MPPVHDYVIDNSTGANVRSDINSVLQAILTNNSNSSAPSTTAAYMWWADTTASIFKIRNSSNDGWINLFTLAGGIDVDAASNFNEDVTFTGASANIVFDKSDSSLEWNDNAKAKFGASEDLAIYHDSTQSIIETNSSATKPLHIKGDPIHFIKTGSSEFMAKMTADSSVKLYFDNSAKLDTISSGIDVTGYVNIGGTSGYAILTGDSQKIALGASQDLTIYHSGSGSFIQDTGTGNLNIASDAFRVLNAGATENMITADENGEAKLYYDNAQKFATKTYGAAVTGSFVTTSDITIENGGDLYLADNGIVRLGNATGGDLKFYHDSSNSYIQHGTTGNLRYQSNNHDFYNQAGNEFMCRMFSDGGVNLYFDHSQKFQVDTNGINVTGGISGASTISTANAGDASATFNRTSSTGIIVELRYEGNNKGTISTDGSNVAFNTSASDRTLKKNFESWNENVLDLFKNINPQKFNFIDQEDTDAKMKGFIAQDLINSFPEGYTKNKENKYMFNPSGMVVYLMKAIQELESKVAALEAA